MTSRTRLVQCHGRNLLLAHIVWATARRAPLLKPSADAWLAEVLRRKASDAGCLLMACGNAVDHVHVAVRYPSTTTVADLVQRLKGASSYEWNRSPRSPPLSWQVGAWAESVSPEHLARTMRYVERQRLHHAGAASPEAWEAVLFPAEASEPTAQREAPADYAVSHDDVQVSARR